MEFLYSFFVVGHFIGLAAIVGKALTSSISKNLSTLAP